MNYIITNNKDFFEKIGNYNYCRLEDMVLPQNIAIDTETTSLKTRKGHMFAVQIGTGKDNYLIDLQKLGNELVFADVIPYIKDKDLVFVNATFDLGWFYKYDFWPEKIWDAMIASMILHNGDSSKRHNFKAIMERELGVVYDKTEQKRIAQIQLSNKEAIQYCFNDVDRLLECMGVLAKKMRDYGVVEAFKLNCQYLRALAYMEQCGMPINVEKWKEKIVGDTNELRESEQAIYNYIYDNLPEYRDGQLDMFSTRKKVTVNLASSQQMIPVFEKLGIDVTSDKDPTKKSIEKSVVGKSSHEFVALWLKYVSDFKVVTTYGENVLEKVEDGWIYSSFNPILDTCRISTRKGEFACLTLPSNERTRVCFEAPQGWKAVVADFSNQESVVSADLHKDPVMVSSIINGDDLHCALARKLFPELEELSDEEIMKNHKKKRQDSKAPRFAKAYGGNGFTIARNMNISEKEGNRISDLYDELHPNIKAWGEEVLKKAIEVGYIESADGFKLKLPYYEEFMELHNWIEGLDKEFWSSYRKGKALRKMYKLHEKLEELIKEFGEGSLKVFEFKDKNYGEMNIEEDEYSYDIYMDNRKQVSDYFKRRGEYFRIALNNPVQTTSAFQTKRSAVLLFNYIVEHNHQWLAKICNIPHDEKFLCVIDYLSEEYKEVLGSCMRKGGNHYLTSGLVTMGADANIGQNWYEAK